MSGHKSSETGRHVHTSKLYEQSQNVHIYRSMRRPGRDACVGEVRCAYRTLRRRPTHRWENIIKIDLREQCVKMETD